MYFEGFILNLDQPEPKFCHFAQDFIGIWLEKEIFIRYDSNI